MRLRWLGVVLAIALALAFAWRAGAQRPQTAVPGAPRTPETPDGGGTIPAEPTADPLADLLPPPPARDIFRYAEAASAPPHRARVEPKALSSVAPAEPEPLPPALRFVGLVRRPEGLRAAVATASGVVIVGPGDVVLGHTVLSLDEDRGLRLRAPDGTEQTLAAAN